MTSKKRKIIILQLLILFAFDLSIVFYVVYKFIY
jgi:hypothetical protein